MSFARLFAPGRIGAMALDNRLCMAPLGTRYCDEDGFVTGRQIDFYAERARGGIGLVIVEATYIHSYTGRMLASHDRYVRGLARLADAIHEAGAKACIQIQTRRGRSDAQEPIAPSAIAHPRTGRVPRAITVDEIEGIVGDFAQAALRARRAGFDGVEIHGASGYLLNEFLSPLANRRTDPYGGTLHNRARFALDVVRRVRRLTDTGLALIYRQCASERVEGGIGQEEAVAFARMLEEAGVDAIDVSSGSTVHSPDWIVAPPHGANVPLAHAIKNAVRIPVIAGGGLDDPETAERVLADGRADFVSLGKALIADPHLPRKVREGRLDDVRPCIRCMLCTDPRMRDNTGVRCKINPRAGRDADYPVRTVAAPKQIAVVGAGPAGLQAAIVLAERGHRVDLYEREAALGGHFRNTTGDEYPKLIRYYERSLAQRGVVVHAAALIDADSAAVASVDAVVIAIGSSQSAAVLAETLRAQGRRVYVVGDSAEPDALLGPVIGAFETAFTVD